MKLSARGALLHRQLYVLLKEQIVTGRTGRAICCRRRRRSAGSSRFARRVPLSIVGDVLDHWLLFAFGVVSVVAASGIVTLAEFTPKLRPLRFMAL